jgi:hypothetical protein
MGMEQKVRFPPEKAPTWPQLVQHLAAQNLPIDLRMIDGELSFPDETPPETWRELRAGTPGGMVTLRREPDGISLVIWGNADEKMRHAWNALAWAIADLSGGMIDTATRQMGAAEFAAAAEVPNTFKTGS